MAENSNATDSDNSLKDDKNDTSDEVDNPESDFYGEARGYKTFSEINGSLASDFCHPDECDGEEYGEAEWICTEVKPEEEEEYEEQYSPLGEFFGEQEHEPSFREKRSLDSEYLKSVLGTPLTHALLDIASLRPTDPIQYLGYYLLRWRWCDEKKDEYEKIVSQLTAERTAHIEQMKEKERQEMLMKEQKAEELRRAEKIESEKSDESDYGERRTLIEE